MTTVPQPDQGPTSTPVPDEQHQPKHRAGAWARLRERWPELVIEVLSIILAISLAFAVDKWAESRRDREQAALLRSAVVAELERNAADLSDALDPFNETISSLDRYASNPEAQSFHVGIDLALLSDAAYRVMQSASAASELDLDWRIDVAQTYALQDIVNQRQQRAIDALTALRPDEDGRLPPDRVDSLRAELSTLGQLRGRLAQRYAEINP